MRNLLIKTFIIVAIFALAACQHSSLDEEVTPTSIDMDMLEALAIADNYLESTNARLGSFDRDVTVLRFMQDLLYNTNDTTGIYLSVNEETITSTTMPGNFVFWFKGAGVKQLLDIEFDSLSQIQLNTQPFELITGYAWVLQIPSDYNTSNEYLKYDIIYEMESGDTIRLDPKIHIKKMR